MCGVCLGGSQSLMHSLHLHPVEKSQFTSIPFRDVPSLSLS